MAVEYVRRGEIYAIRMDSGVGSEQGYFRPGLIISSNAGNSTSPNVIVAYMTTKYHNIGTQYGPTKATGIPSYVMCDQLATVSKERLGRKMGYLSENEMHEVENKLDEVLDLGYVDDTPLKEKEAEVKALNIQIKELRDEIAGLNAKQSSHDNEIHSRDVEIAMWKGLYEKALNMVVDMKFASDVALRSKVTMKEQEIAEPKPVEAEPKKSEPTESKLVDINTAKFSVLRGIGFSKNIVLNVIDKRPYEKIEDLKKVPGVTSVMYNLVRNKICCIPVPEPVVVEPKVEEPPKPVVVEQEKPVEEPPKPEEPMMKAGKVNVNTASAQEIHDASGLSMTACFAITGKRKREGLFKSLDELIIPGRLSAAVLDKYRDKFEV